MRYALVNDRIKKNSWCFCCSPISNGYVRKLTTRLYFCSLKCFEHQEQTAILAIEFHAREVS